MAHNYNVLNFIQYIAVGVHIRYNEYTLIQCTKYNTVPIFEKIIFDYYF